LTEVVMLASPALTAVLLMDVPSAVRATPQIHEGTSHEGTLLAARQPHLGRRPPQLGARSTRRSMRPRLRLACCPSGVSGAGHRSVYGGRSPQRAIVLPGKSVRHWRHIASSFARCMRVGLKAAWLISVISNRSGAKLSFCSSPTRHLVVTRSGVLRASLLLLTHRG